MTVWNIENKLIEVRKPGMIARYTYDALGRRMSKEVNGVTKQFRYDGEDLIMEMNSEDSITANYTFGPGIDNPLMMNRSDKNYYYVKDGLGSVTALTDSTSNIIKEYKYSVFGKIVDETGDSTLANPFTYTAREYDKETGNYYYRARYYSPEMGRFISEDPLGLAVDNNFYQYTINNPINMVDPLGLVPPEFLSKERENNLKIIVNAVTGNVFTEAELNKLIPPVVDKTGFLEVIQATGIADKKLEKEGNAKVKLTKKENDYLDKVLERTKNDKKYKNDEELIKLLKEAIENKKIALKNGVCVIGE